MISCIVAGAWISILLVVYLYWFVVNVEVRAFSAFIMCIGIFVLCSEWSLAKLVECFGG